MKSTGSDSISSEDPPRHSSNGNIHLRVVAASNRLQTLSCGFGRCLLPSASASPTHPPLPRGPRSAQIAMDTAAKPDERVTERITERVINAAGARHGRRAQRHLRDRVSRNL